MRYPWQTQTWQTLMAQQARLPHAILLTGEAGTGKLAFARHLAQALLCEAADQAQRPCEVCDACRWFAAGNHPDFRELAPSSDDEDGEGADDTKAKKKKSEIIKIEQVRALANFVYLTSHRGGRKLVIVQPAEALNAASANALLKTLEEPPEGAVFILVSHAWRRLLPTILSRCRRLPMPMPAPDIAARWLAEQGLADAADHLAEAGGAPLLALQRADAAQSAARDAFLTVLAQPAEMDVLKVAEQLDKQKIEPERVLSWLSRWVYDLARLELAGSVRYYPARAAQMAGLRAMIQPQRLMRYQDELSAAIRLAHHPLNARLVYERLLLGYRQAVH